MVIYKYHEVTIANGQTKSDPFDFRAGTAFALHVPASFTGATVTFEGSDQYGGTFVQVVDDTGAAVSVTATDAKAVGLSTALMDRMRAFAFIKIVSASAETGAKTIGVSVKG